MKELDEKIVLVVHSVDTEGPLHEPLQASFERINELYGIDDVEQTQENLEKLRRGEINLGGKEQVIKETLSGHLISYNSDWSKIDAMLESIMSDNFRSRNLDSFGGSWVFNWHVLDHVGYDTNPRRRTTGFHAIRDHYLGILKQYPKIRDPIHFHFHPMSTYREAHRCATSYLNSPHLLEIINRQILERDTFPTAYRAGFQAERPDSHWFLEQWIPFDFTNMAMEDPTHFNRSIDFKNGRSGDWRLAPADWSVYQPSHDNYQIPGNCRRWIARSLNILNRVAPIDQAESDKAFRRADGGKPTLMGVTSHDFRNLEYEVDFVAHLIKNSAERYPNVRFKYCEAIEAFRMLQNQEVEAETNALELRATLYPASSDDVPTLHVEVTNGEVFGPQPWLAMALYGGKFMHDNLDFSMHGNEWFYAFHGDTLPLEDVKRIGIAANDRYGNRCVVSVDLDRKKPISTPIQLKRVSNNRW